MTELAQVDAAMVMAPEQQQYLTFVVEGAVYAVGILSIKEIIGYGRVTAVPMTPKHLRGVINLRGQVVPVVDLAARFGHGGGKVGKRSCIIILDAEAEGETLDLGVVVDSVVEAVEIAPADVEPAPPFGAQVPTEFIKGMGRVNGGFVTIVNVARVLDTTELGSFERPRLAAH